MMFIYFGAIFGNDQALLLVLHLEITVGCTWGTLWDSDIKSRSAA